MIITLGVGEMAILIIALAFLVLVAASIPTLLQLKKTVKAMEDLAVESKTAVTNVNTIIKSAGEQVGDLEELTKKAKDVGLDIVDLLEGVMDTIKSPLLTLVGLIVGLEFGFRKLVKREKKEKKEPETAVEKGGE
ncbi:MAG: DUF948 domain-containing protein [Thermodesulfobacteriota bacterium]